MFLRFKKTMHSTFVALLLLSFAYFGCHQKTPVHNVIESEDASFVIDTVAVGLQVVFGMTWLPDGRAILTERRKATQNMSLFDIESGELTPICNLPEVVSRLDGGMLDVVAHHAYRENGWIYFSYSAMKPDSSSTLIVERARINKNCLADREKILEVLPWYKSFSHYGSRMLIKDGYLYVSMGERYDARDSAQSLGNHFGKILRVYDDGTIPADNPFVNTKGALSEIWSYGHRNPQGMAVHPVTGELWINEHGPQGGDEINIIKPGANYGWPVVTYGEEYGGGKIGSGITSKAGMEQPLHYWTPSIAPGSMVFYSGKAFPAWRGNIFSGAMGLRHLNRIVLQRDTVVKEERLLLPQKWRVRLVTQGLDGYLYLGVDNGMLLRLRPSE